MKEHDLKISLTNIRAIEQADIILDGITVLAGENGCGKSTISKLAYYIFKTSIEFDSIVERKFEKYMKNIANTLDILARELFLDGEDIHGFIEEEYIALRERIFSLYSINRGLDEKKLNAVIDQFINKVKIKDGINESNSLIGTKRIKRILNDSLPLKNVEKTNSITVLLGKIKIQILNKNKNTEYLKTIRPVDFLNEELGMAFYDNPLPKRYRVTEYEEEIINPSKHNISPFYSVSNVAYIDSPMLFGVDVFTERRAHWRDLNNILNRKSQRHNGRNIEDVFEGIIGKASRSEDIFSNKSFIYKRKDGKEFDLLECATGIKSFAVLQILFKNGFLTDKTLLIIDEPEAHLHPQWVVEYARLIVLLHKHVGVRFLIASHHPDMVSAIKYISEKEQVDDKLQYYLAEQTGGEFKYNYKELGTDIEAIFESFNIAFERMDLYGNTE